MGPTGKWIGVLAMGILGCSNNNGATPTPDLTMSGGNDMPTGGGGDMAMTGACNGGPGTVLFTASGEVLALGGYAFPPATTGAAAFVDGWEVQFTKFFAVFDKVTLSTNPDTSPTDQSQTGAVVAEIDGPWAIDLHKGGSLPGKGGTGEQAYPIQAICNQNKNGGAAFDPTARYAFGFSSVPATSAAQLIQIDANDPDWLAMVANQWNVLYVGTATWKGTAGGNTCTNTGSNYTFNLPSPVNFKFGFATPTTYFNCQNPDNDPAMGLNGEDHQRGVTVRANAQTVAQVTFHTDHPFWESFTHDTPAHFDQLAALATKDANGNYNVTLDMTKGVNYTAFKDQNGQPMPWHACAPGYAPPNSNPQMGFDSLSIPYNPAGTPDKVMRDYWDYMRYDQSTQGHLNSDGLCFVQRHYPSPQ
jgi:hypothetical protein